MTSTEGALPLHPTRCAICETLGGADELYPAAFDESVFNARVYSARRMPERVHYRMVTCRTCGLVRSDPVLDDDVVSGLYEESSFDYGAEVDSIADTYLRELERAAPQRGRLLEIGCGNGFVLERALASGWSGVAGIEPSTDAIANAAPQVREHIVKDVVRPGLFEPGSFDVVALFQVLDHLADPVTVLRECLSLLRPGGVVVAFNHDRSAWSARLLGERSPIVDIEHTYLYEPATMRALFGKVGFTGIDVRAVRNTYSVSYLAQLVPGPAGPKERLIGRMRETAIGRRTLTVPLGNLCLTGRRP